MRYGSPAASYGGSTFAASLMSYGVSTYAGSAHGDPRTHGDTTEIYPGRQAHYFGGRRGECEDDDF
jgi:hypothetical protein